MTAMQAKLGASTSIEYSVYVYFDPKKAKKSNSPWEMKGVTDNMDRAMADAEKFHNSREFQKVEVKKKYFDEKNSRTVDMILKTFDGNFKKEMSALLILVLAILASGAAGGLAYFLTL